MQRIATGSMIVAGCLLTLAACSPPESRPLEGQIAARVRASLDSGVEEFDHRLWDELLRVVTVDGLVDYELAAAHRPQLDDYLAALAVVDLGELEGMELKALLINAYNAFTVASILDHPQVASIRDIQGVWDRRRHRLGGFELTLDDIEHRLLRPFFRDPRIHFAVNCASRSCAPLPPWAYVGSALDDQLEERARAFLRDPANVRLEGRQLLLSSYFDWYGDDFTAEGWTPRAATIPEFVAVYAQPEVAAAVAATPPLQVSFLDYDWSLNRSPAIGAS